MRYNCSVGVCVHARVCVCYSQAAHTSGKREVTSCLLRHLTFQPHRAHTHTHTHTHTLTHSHWHTAVFPLMYQNIMIVCIGQTHKHTRTFRQGVIFFFLWPATLRVLKALQTDHIHTKMICSPCEWYVWLLNPPPSPDCSRVCEIEVCVVSCVSLRKKWVIFLPSMLFCWSGFFSQSCT